MRTTTCLGLVLASVMLAACASDATVPEDNGGNTYTPDEPEVVPLTDADLWRQAMADGQWTWYKLSADTLSPAGNSPHFARLRTRYNAVASVALDSTGVVGPATIFQNGALIVKEIFTDGSLAAVAVMRKALDDPNAGHGSWLWAEYGPAGEVLHSLTQPEATCHDCHFSGLDHTRMNDTHP